MCIRENKVGYTALRIAVENERKEIISLLMTAGAIDTLGRTALMFAAQYGDDITVKRLLIEGVDINVKDKNRNTALLHAASNGKVEITKILLNAGTDVNAKNKRRNTALILAVWYGHIDTVETLLNAGADVSVKNKRGWSALKVASKAIGNKKIARMLLKAGAVQ